MQDRIEAEPDKNAEIVLRSTMRRAHSSIQDWFSQRSSLLKATGGLRSLQSTSKASGGDAGLLSALCEVL